MPANKNTSAKTQKIRTYSSFIGSVKAKKSLGNIRFFIAFLSSKMELEGETFR